jgi:hypothetical protein
LRNVVPEKLEQSELFELRGIALAQAADKKTASVSEGRFAFAELILFARCRGRGRRRGLCAAVSTAVVHDDAGAFPGFNAAFWPNSGR